MEIISNYTPDIKRADNFIKMVVDRALKTLLIHLNTEKNLINRNASSMDYSPIDEDEESKEYHDFIGDEELNPEYIYFDKLEKREKLNKLVNQLSKMEYTIFKALVISFNKNNYGNHTNINKLTGINKKSIDNALQRIRLKASKIS